MPQASGEKLRHTGPAKKKRVASVPKREQLANSPQLLLKPRQMDHSIQLKLLGLLPIAESQCLVVLQFLF